MALNVEELLQPIPGGDPCGAELRHDAGFIELAAAAAPDYDYERGPDGREVARLKPRDWAKIGRGARALLTKGRDLRVQILLLRSLLATDGLVGLAQGLELVHRSLEAYWDNLHPVLDPEQQVPAEQALERTTAFGELTVHEGLTGEGLLLAELRRAVIIKAPKLGATLSLREIEIAQGRARAAAGEEPMDPTRLDTILKDAGLEAIAAARAALATAQGALNGIAELFLAKLDAMAVPDFRPMQQVLTDIDAALAGYAAPEPAASEPATAAASAEPLAASLAEASAPATSATGAKDLSRINDRGEVVRALELILDYYRREEPSSPIPLLIERIKKLVRMNFLELMAELAPAGVPEFKALAGIEGEEA